jgi:hypothetical protein
VIDNDRVVIDVGGGCPRAQGVRDLVGVAVGGHPGADVKELADAFVPGQPPYRAGEERPVVVRGTLPVGGHFPDLVSGFAVWAEVVFPVAQGVVYPGDVRFPWVEGGHDAALSGRRSLLHLTRSPLNVAVQPFPVRE